MTRHLRTVWYAALYYLSWIWFGLGGLLLDLACIPLLLLPNRKRFGRATRATTRRMFNLWLQWLNTSGVVRISWRGFDQPLPTGVVYVANHPCLVDAPFLLARLPDTICIFKSALIRNPFLGPAALMSGYVSAADQGVDLVRKVAGRIIAGQSLLIFPEGTRTAEDTVLNPLKPGFALIASRACTRLQLIQVRVSPRLARRGRPWWHIPPLPGWAEFTLDESYPVDHETDLEALVARVEARFRSTLTLESANA